ncbi:MAG: hypothetical protein LBM18_04940 [Oscillospiraceae bacterium]|nr:hypothetical protein [Oscillospiraceae bacterium]
MRELKFADVTLREAAKTAESSLSFKEKIEIAKTLDRLNVDVIETAALTMAMTDSLLLKSIAAAVASSVVSVPVGLTEQGVALAWESVKGAAKPRLRVVVPMSPVQMEYVCHKKPEAVLLLTETLIKACRELCEDVEFVAEDATRSETEFLSRAIKAAIAAGAGTVTLCDAAGTMLPDELASFIGSVRESVPEFKGISLGVQCSNELGMAVACAAAAISAGAAEIKTAVSDPHFPALDAVCRVVSAKGTVCGATCRIRATELSRATDQIKQLTDSRRSKQSPFDGVREYPAGDTLSVTDDLPTVSAAIRKLGYDLTDEDTAKVYEAFRHLAGKKTVSPKELDVIVASHALQVPAAYHLVSYVINSGNIITATANVSLQKDGKTLSGICPGDGPIDAAFLAIEQIVGRHYELDDFQIQAVTEGREAMGAATVRLRSDGKLFSGRGISTDIIGASIRAYLNALNKIVYEEAQR